MTTHYLIRGRHTRPRSDIHVRLEEVEGRYRDIGGRSITRFTAIDFGACEASLLGFDRSHMTLDPGELIFIGRTGRQLRSWWLRWSGNARRLGTAKQLVALKQQSGGFIPRALSRQLAVLEEVNLRIDSEIGHTYTGQDYLVEVIPEQVLERLEQFLLSLSDG